MSDKCEDKYAVLEKNIGYSFHDRTLLEVALTHRSYSSEVPGLADNQRLEFFGDAVLDFLVSTLLFTNFPDAREGELTRMRAALVDEASLSGIASKLGIGACLSLGKGEAKSGGREKRSLLADAYEAMIAAIYLDGGIIAVRKVVKKHFAVLTQVRTSAGIVSSDYKTELQELTQSVFASAPVYELTATEGPDHDRVYTVSVSVNGAIAGAGQGRSKKEAQQAAACAALAQLKR